jgi:hypothetical protein
MRHMVPEHVWSLVSAYGLEPQSGERKPPPEVD